MPAISNAKDTGPDESRGRHEGHDSPSPDLADVEARLREARGEMQPQREEAPSARSAAYRLGSEIIAGLLAGSILGWGLDKLFATSPWLLIVCMLLGFAGGVMNAIRQLQDWNRRMGEPPGGEGGAKTR